MKTFIKKLPAGKIKVLLTAVMTACMILQGTVVSAENSNEITLSASGNEAGIELYFPQAAAEEIASMQISVKVTADVQGTDLEYIPDSSLSGRIVESRYQSSTGTLNIYIAGTTALFSHGQDQLRQHCCCHGGGRRKLGEVRKERRNSVPRQ